MNHHIIKPSPKTKFLFCGNRAVKIPLHLLRRGDSPDNADIVHEFLEKQFSAETIFRDIDAIPLGADFQNQIEHAIDACDVVLVLIGDHWLDIKDDQGKQRLFQADDPVRRELGLALRSEPPYVLPCLFGARRCQQPQICPKNCGPCLARTA